MRELDTLLLSYLDERFVLADDAEQDAFRRFVSLQDPEIFALLTGRLSSDDAGIALIVCQLRVKRVSAGTGASSAR